VRPPVLEERELEPAAIDGALRSFGGFFVAPSGAESLLARMLAASRSFFDRPREEKRGLAIEHSAHFRGWSEMRNPRDWREQLHLGRERPPGGDRPAFRQLEGPNLWPDDAAWRAIVETYTDRATTLGATILVELARALGVDEGLFGNVAGDGYRVVKLIGYHPQPSAGEARSGVAAHVDFSWLTINLQDSAGLEVRCPDGRWAPVEVRPGALWVHCGELLEHATHGRYRATPHRVVNPSTARMRVSIPVFVNPALDAMVPVLAQVQPAVRAKAPSEHVHRVLDPAASRRPFLFGEAEWRRKGRGGWCFECCRLAA
jgi:isopenicillin N synthase-like dioxygenase